jgi:hypothetical protein
VFWELAKAGSLGDGLGRGLLSSGGFPHPGRQNVLWKYKYFSIESCAPTVPHYVPNEEGTNKKDLGDLGNKTGPDPAENPWLELGKLIILKCCSQCNPCLFSFT